MQMHISPPVSISTYNLDLLLGSNPNLIAVFDASDRLILANASFREVYFCDPAQRPYWHEFMRQNFIHRRGPLIETDDIEAWLTAADARRGTVPHRAFEAEMVDGRIFWITETLDLKGFLVLVASEITALKAPGRNIRVERDEARRASWTDELTDVANRRYVMKTLRDWLSQRLQEETFGEHAIALIDIDRFKDVNDRYGHDFGDVVLIEFCRRFVSGIRLQDLFGRMGGEEFLLFLPNCSVADATLRLQAILKDIGSIRFAQAPDYSCSFSTGICSVRPDRRPDRTLDHTLSTADRLLYQAKASGRRCIVSEEPAE
ncbi:sensor domain-containing diguanylate cyclase [Pararhizobium haloflavum]|uniref:sensor domain-containing diguanylate cyclase n=1 Tax=Pararhizobium haloflavum TaxID=2037914 RepID=UPI000C19BB63|nr:sensor domain-containing diguanylate cyclase [Pararhizobium haloflavum]